MGMRLMLRFQQISNVGKDRQMAGTFDGSGHPPLVFQRVARDPSWQQLSLFIYKLRKKCIVFVVDVLESKLFEPAVFGFALPDRRIAQKLYFVLCCHVVLLVG